jgi:hypothetical protein
MNMEQRAIPLMLQPPAVGQSGSFVNAAVPELALASEAQADDAADPAAAVMAVGSPQHSRSSRGSGSGAAESALSGGGVEVIGGGSISSILAAANSQKDYEVRPRVLPCPLLAALVGVGLGSRGVLLQDLHTSRAGPRLFPTASCLSSPSPKCDSSLTNLWCASLFWCCTCCY